MTDHIKYLSAIGRKGGRSKSKAKRTAARINGCKGGRPRSPVSINGVISRIISQPKRKLSTGLKLPPGNF